MTTAHPQFQRPHYQNIPQQLKAGHCHVIWKPEQRGDKMSKTPYNACALLQSHKYYKASATNPRSWSSFSEAVDAQEQYHDIAGIGRVLTDGIMLIDLDHSVNHETGEIHPAALEILSLFDTYAELSPTDGIHIFPLARLPKGTNKVYHYKGLKVELYDADRYSTLTGVPIPGVPFIPEVKDQQAQVTALVERLRQGERENTSVCVVCDSHSHVTAQHTAQQKTGQRQKRNTSEVQGKIQVQAPPLMSEQDLPKGDQLILAKARAAKNARAFNALWEGGDPHKRHDASRADFDLILLLLYWTGDSQINDTSAQVERLFRSSGRYRPEKTDRLTAKRKQYTYLQMSIYNARCKRYGVPLPLPAPREEEPTPEGERQVEERKRKSCYQVIRYAHAWMLHPFDQERWNAELYDLAQQAKQDMMTHFQEGKKQLRVTALPPGIGKSHAFGDLCDEMNLAVIVPRHEVIQSVASYQRQRHIQTAHAGNCPDHEKHQQIASLGYNTRPVHQTHEDPCAYIQQFEEQGSAIYQIAHSETCYVPQHEGIAIDEFNLPDWLHEYRYTVERLKKAAHQFATETPASRFLVAWQSMLTTLADEHGEGSYQGKLVFDILNQHLHGNLVSLLGMLQRDGHATNPHPWPRNIDDEQLPEVILPALFSIAISELAKWQRGQDFNSCVRVVVSKQKQVLFSLTIPRAINTLAFDGGHRAVGMADATADQEVLRHWYGKQVEVVRLAKDPPPHMKHLHLAERCAKRSMQAKHGRDQARVIRKLRYLLKKLDPTGEKTCSGLVGLITYLGNEEPMRLALGIPAGKTAHFWAARGSNALESCEILLMVGTPTLAPETMYRIARTVYRDDPQPIVEGSARDEQNRPRYLDYRVQNLSDYLTNAELTQCAHRHRPLRYDGRILVSICEGDIDYLPVTHHIAHMPRLTDEGEDTAEIKEAEDFAKLEQARRQLEAQDIPLAVHRLARLARVATDTAARYLRGWRARQSENTHTPHQCFQTVPESTNKDSISNSRYKDLSESSELAPTPPEKRPGTATTPPVCLKPCGRCGRIDDWVRNPTGEIWICSCYYWWYEHPEWRSRTQLVGVG